MVLRENWSHASIVWDCGQMLMSEETRINRRWNVCHTSSQDLGLKSANTNLRHTSQFNCSFKNYQDIPLVSTVPDIPASDVRHNAD